jgi:hypothetical protein
MRRPRWHDVLIVSALIALAAAGVWAIWWDDVRAALHLGPAKGSAGEPTSTPAGPIGLPRT